MQLIRLVQGIQCRGGKCSFQETSSYRLASIATPFPYLGTSQDANFFDSVSILRWMKSSEHIYLFGFGLSKLFPGPILLGPRTPHKSILYFEFKFINFKFQNHLINLKNKVYKIICQSPTNVEKFDYSNLKNLD